MTSSHLTIETVATHPLHVLAVSGNLALNETPRLMSTLTRAMQESPTRSVICVVRDLIAPTSAALLMAFPAALRRGGGWPNVSLELAGPGPDLADQLRRLHMSRFLPVHPSVETVMAGAVCPPESIHRHFTFTANTAGLRAARTATRELWPSRVRTESGYITDSVLLITNELVSNAIIHVAEPFTLSLEQSPDRALVAVTDSSRNEPILRPTRARATTGRGVQIIAGLSHDWGIRLVHPRGKTVWASLMTTTQPPV